MTDKPLTDRERKQLLELLQRADGETLADIGSTLRAARKRVVQRDAPITVSARSMILEALSMTMMPSTLRLLTRVVDARTGAELPASARSATLRRDEQRRWERAVATGMAPPPVIAPALEATFFTPTRGELTVSTWDLADRLITPIQPRWAEAVLPMRLAEEARRIAELDEKAALGITMLALTSARALPGGARLLGGNNATLAVLVDICQVAEAQRERFEAAYVDELSTAMERGRDLDERDQVWGRRERLRMVTGGRNG